MSEIAKSFSKIAAGLKTKSIYKSFRVHQIHKSMKESEIQDALNMYPEQPSLAKKKSNKEKPVALIRPSVKLR